VTTNGMADLLQGCGVLPPMDEGEPTPGRKPAGNGRGKGQGGDRFVVLNGFIDFTMAGLTRNEIAVWMVLYRDTRDGQARVTQASIAERAGVSRRTVIRAVERLRGRGLLRVVRQGGLAGGPSVYEVVPFAARGV
jgi:hypothetical protein